MSKEEHSCCTPSRPDKPVRATGSQEFDSIPLVDLEDMVKIGGETFLMGTGSKEGFRADGEGPVREVRVDPFYIDQSVVTNAQFNVFVKETGYKTEAEKYGWSFVFYHFVPWKLLKNDPPSPPGALWWKAIEGACWKYPEGPGSKINDRMDHPAVHVSWNDASAYCQWAGKRLPTEAEWEYAARGGLEQQRYPWGNELMQDGEHQCNIWQGEFPEHNTEEDGYAGPAPARSFEPNEYGLFNMAGNIWEWCSDWFSPSYSLLCIKDNPPGPGSGDAKVIRGGSYLCHKSYCNRYRVAARTANTPDSSSGNMGFRCAKDVEN